MSNKQIQEIEFKIKDLEKDKERLIKKLHNSCKHDLDTMTQMDMEEATGGIINIKPVKFVIL